ncbi:MAG: L,D-transpeptidase [Chloroflexi bacterium]|nr:L,D-transpeptidase [Chloroflexota bacterium]
MPSMSRYSRRDFLKSFGVGLAGLAIPMSFSTGKRISVPRLGRVASESLSVYSEPSDKSAIRFQRFRDNILHLYQDVVSEDGPGYNPVWHRVWGGYVHSAFVQPVENRLNPILPEFPSSGNLMEVTVPYTQSYRIRQNGKWEVFYRLYYSSTHFAFETVVGPDGEPFYKVNNSLLNLSYYVRAVDMRTINTSELTPIHPEVSPQDKRIEISIDFQSLRAFEYDELVLNHLDLLPTDTPKGNHVIRIKRPSVHMGDGTLRSDADAYELPGVPWVSYFAVEGYAIHGTYWHNNFGMTMSKGCINMRSEDAKWIYRWCSPYPLEEKENSAYRTKVLVY